MSASVEKARNAILAATRGPKPFRTLRGHTKLVQSVAFFHNGRWVVTGSEDKSLKIWDVQKGTLVGQLEGHEDTVWSISTSPDDRRIVSGGCDNKIIIWDVESRQAVFDPLVKHTDWVKSVCFSPDGKRFASCSGDTSVVVWDTETGTVLATFDGHRSDVSTVAFSPDGIKLASASADRTIRVWHADTAELLLELNDQAHVRFVVWSPDGQQLVSASEDHTVKFWQVSNGDQIGEPWTGHGMDWINGLSISSDASFLAIATSFDKSVRLWSTKTRKQIGQSYLHATGAYCLALSPDQELLASGDFDGRVYLWSIKDTIELHVEQGKEKEELEAEQRQYLASAVSVLFPRYT